MWPALLPALLLMPAAAGAAAPSFDCAKADSAAEKLVCSDPTLAALDRELARLATPASDCRQASDLRICLVAAYLRRINQLTQDDPGTEEAGIALGPFTVACEDFAPRIGLTIVKTDPQLAWLEWQDDALVLTQTVSASGARYATEGDDGETVFWIKGKAARFDRPGEPTLDCRIE